MATDKLTINQKLRTVFWGTQEFAAEILEALVQDARFEIKLVITQPDRPSGRHQDLQSPPAKIVAVKHGLAVDQPENLKDYRPPVDNYHLNIICQYGLIVPELILNTPVHKSINVHPSLLPKYRGATPVQTALLNGDDRTGVSIMLMDKQMDHGPILAQETLSIASDDTYITLSDKLVEKAKILLLDTAPAWVKGEIKAKPQDNSQATFCGLLNRDQGQIDWKKPAQQIYNQFRALTPWPGIWTTLDGQRLKIQKLSLAVILNRSTSQGAGQIDITDDQKMIVWCGEGAVDIKELQLAGKRSLSARDFIQGYPGLKKLGD